jgi:peptide chain release factor 1
MYSKYFETKGWKVDVTNISEGTAGGCKEIVLSITGAGVYDLYGHVATAADLIRAK